MCPAGLMAANKVTLQLGGATVICINHRKTQPKAENSKFEWMEEEEESKRL